MGQPVQPVLGNAGFVSHLQHQRGDQRTEIGVAVVNGIANARVLLNEIRNGRDDIHFIEVMACPGGCIGGGGQPYGVTDEIRKARSEGLYSEDESALIRYSHENPSLKKLYGDLKDSMRELNRI